MCTATFSHTIPKRLLPHPGPNVSQTSEPKGMYAKPTLVRPTFLNSYHEENILSSKSTVGISNSPSVSW